MQEKLTSEGKCLFCGKTFAKAGINRHLITHLNEKDNAAGISFLIKVETDPRWGKTPYFLSLWVDGEATLKQLDKFLRDIWLECCGHMSAFRYKAAGNPTTNFNSLLKSISQPRVSTGEFDEIPLKNKAKNVFYPDMKLDYEYDFGSSTELEISVVSIFPYKADKNIVLLSRNEPLKIMCFICGKVPATQICTVCMDDDDDAVFCDKCAQKHAKECEDFDDYASMPIVNSPRMGACAYEGGSIDTERDGVFVLKK